MVSKHMNEQKLPAPTINKLEGNVLSTNDGVILSVYLSADLGFKGGDTINPMWGGYVFSTQQISTADIQSGSIDFPVPPDIIKDTKSINASYVKTDENNMAIYSDSLNFTIALGNGSTGDPDSIKLDISKNNAPANGDDTNTATVFVSSGGVGVDGIEVDLVVSGNALFVNGKNTATVKTKSGGSASLQLTDSTVETVKVTASVSDDASLYDSKNAVFIAQTVVPDLLTLDDISDHAPADGQSHNSLIATVTGKGAPAPGASVDLTIRGSETAYFEQNGRSEMTLLTNSEGTAKVDVVDTKPETITIYCSLSDNAALSQHKTITFDESGDQGQYQLALDIILDNSISGSGEPNKLLATVSDSSTGLPVKGVEVSVKSNQHSYFENTGNNTTTVVTDKAGQANIEVFDDFSEHVVVVATLLESGVSMSKTVTFKKDYGTVKIVEALNKNKSFGPGQPTTAWEGASFTLNTTGGSNNFTWEVIAGSPAIVVAPMPNGSAKVTIHQKFDNEACVIRVTDKETEESDTYQFEMSRFYHMFQHKVYWGVLVYDELIQKSLLSVDALLAVYDEWGDMTNYGAPWIDGSDEALYWSDEVILFGSCEATVVNLSDGSTKKHFLPELLIEVNELVTLEQ